MDTKYINRKLYDAIFNFYTDTVSQEYYYKTVFSPTGNKLQDGISYSSS